MSARATVTDRGAVLLGKNVACDAFEETKPLRVVTHAHADHMVGLRQSLRTCRKSLDDKSHERHDRRHAKPAFSVWVAW